MKLSNILQFPIHVATKNFINPDHEHYTTMGAADNAQIVLLAYLSDYISSTLFL